jgi:hypothetical protein
LAAPPRRAAASPSAAPPRALLTGLTLNAARASKATLANARPLPTSPAPADRSPAPVNPLELELQ